GALAWSQDPLMVPDKESSCWRRLVSVDKCVSRMPRIGIQDDLLASLPGYCCRDGSHSVATMALQHDLEGCHASYLDRESPVLIVIESLRVGTASVTGTIDEVSWRHPTPELIIICYARIVYWAV